ncbi:MAG: hypothetical protein HW416_869 [Chloroflexi bacterium]|nr:hypothetical protein [Chloroflexota bacterium]
MGRAWRAGNLEKRLPTIGRVANQPLVLGDVRCRSALHEATATGCDQVLALWLLTGRLSRVAGKLAQAGRDVLHE